MLLQCISRPASIADERSNKTTTECVVKSILEDSDIMIKPFCIVKLAIALE